MSVNQSLNAVELYFLRLNNKGNTAVPYHADWKTITMYVVVGVGFSDDRSPDELQACIWSCHLHYVLLSRQWTHR